MSEMKPCPNPWCESTDLAPWDYGDCLTCVQCLVCGLIGPAAETEDEARRLWNDRPDVAEAVAAERERLYGNESEIRISGEEYWRNAIGGTPYKPAHVGARTGAHPVTVAKAMAEVEGTLAADVIASLVQSAIIAWSWRDEMEKLAREGERDACLAELSDATERAEGPARPPAGAANTYSAGYIHGWIAACAETMAAIRARSGDD